MTVKETIEILQKIKNKELEQSHKPTEICNLSFVNQELKSLDFSNITIKNCDFSHANLEKSRFLNTQFYDCIFDNSIISNCNFSGALFNKVCFDNVKAQESVFGITKWIECNSFLGNFEKATFTKTEISNSDFRCAIMNSVRFYESNLINVDFTETKMRHSDLSLTNVKDSIFNNADLRETKLMNIKNYEKAQWIGTDVRDINFFGAYLMRRFVVDQNYLDEVKTKNKLSNAIYWIWKITSDCGRSMALWCFWITIIMVSFAFIYNYVNIDFGAYKTPFSSFYFSVVTFTTLGFGDVLPMSAGAQIATVCEVIIGYLMLGGLLSILSNKIARRAD